MALLQAYGDAVVEEAPLFAISNYEVMFFCHRNFTDVRDKRIWASPPIAWNSVSLPPRAAWLHFLAVAQECCTLRSKSLCCSEMKYLQLLHQNTPCLYLAEKLSG